MRQLILFLAFFLNFTSFCQKTEVVYEYADQYIDSLKTWKIQETPFTTIKFFDEKGNLIKYKTGLGKNNNIKKLSESNLQYDQNQNIIREEFEGLGYQDTPYKTLIEKKFNNKNLIEEKISFFNFDKKIYEYNSITKYIFNDKSQLALKDILHISYFGPDFKRTENQSISTYFYDENGNLLFEKQKNTSSNSYSTDYQSIYNSNNQKIESRIINNYGSGPIIVSRTTYNYDSSRNLVEFQSYDHENLLYKKAEIAFNEMNLEILSKTFNYNAEKKEFQLVVQTFTDYNTNGQKTKLTYWDIYERNGIDAFVVGKIISVREDLFTYNSQSNLIQRDAILYSIENNVKTFHTPERIRYEYENQTNNTENFDFDKYQVYPNPAVDIIKIDNTITNDCLNSIHLFSISGQKIADFKKDKLAKCSWELNLPQYLQKGIYFP